MPFLKLLADAGRRFLGIFHAAEFSCADCEYWNSCPGATDDDCVFRAGQAMKWKQKRLPTLPVNAAAFIPRVQ